MGLIPKVPPIRRGGKNHHHPSGLNMELSPGHDRAILQERSKGALRAYHLEDVDMWATKNSLLLSMESWLVYRDP